MANSFLDLPMPAGDGAGTSVDTSAMGKEKTLIVGGAFVGATVAIEVSNDGGTEFQPVAIFSSTGKQVILAAAQFMRVFVRGRSAEPFSANADVGSHTKGGDFIASLPVSSVDGAGAPVDISALGSFKTFVAGGLFEGASLTVELSEDGTSYSPCLSFFGFGEAKSKEVIANWARVQTQGRAGNTFPFTASISVGGTKDISGVVVAHDLGGAEHTADTLANLNTKVSDGTLIDTADSRLSDVRDTDAIITTTGPTTMAVGAVADGQFLVRSGAAIIGGSPNQATDPLQQLSTDLELGSTQYAGIADGAEGGILDGMLDLTVEIWMKRESDGTVMAVIGKGTDDGDLSWYLRVSGTFISWYLSVNGSTIIASSFGGLVGATGKWTHIAMTRDGTTGTITLYRGGISQGSGNRATGNLFASASDFRIGALGDGTQLFDGLLSNARVWNVVRTGPEILANMYKLLPTDEPGLIASYPMDGNWEDKTANANHLTPVNAPTFIDNAPVGWATHAIVSDDGPIFIDGVAPTAVGQTIVATASDAASWQTPAPDADAIHDNVNGEINAVTEKAAPIAADLVLIEDSAASNSKKKAQVSNLNRVGKANVPLTLGAADTTFAVSSDLMTITGDGGANTLATITGGYSGQELTLIFVDALVTITDDNTHAADNVDLSGPFTSADDTVLKIVFNGTSWYEVSRSVN